MRNRRTRSSASLVRGDGGVFDRPKSKSSNRGRCHVRCGVFAPSLEDIFRVSVGEIPLGVLGTRTAGVGRTYAAALSGEVGSSALCVVDLLCKKDWSTYLRGRFERAPGNIVLGKEVVEIQFHLDIANLGLR